MKRLILIASILIVSLAGVKAQRSVQWFQSDQTIHKAGIDTNSGTASTTTYLKITGKLSGLTIMTGVTKLTGTPATGFSVKLYGSNDKAKWDYVTTSIDTLAVGNVAPEQVKKWVFTSNPFLWYRIVCKGFGTQTSKLSTNALLQP